MCCFPEGQSLTGQPWLAPALQQAPSYSHPASGCNACATGTMGAELVLW